MQRGAAPDELPEETEERSMDELVFEVTQEGDGGDAAACLSEDIFTEADTWEELRENVREAVLAYHYDSEPPQRIRLHLVRDEVVAARSSCPATSVDQNWSAGSSAPLDTRLCISAVAISCLRQTRPGLTASSCPTAGRSASAR
jgi:hypothetical protein